MHKFFFSFQKTKKKKKKEEVISHFSFLRVLKQFPDICPLLSELIVIERYNHLKREKRKRCIGHREIKNLPHQSKKKSLSIEQGVFVLPLTFLSGNASFIQLNSFLRGVEMLVALFPNGAHLAYNNQKHHYGASTWEPCENVGIPVLW